MPNGRSPPPGEYEIRVAAQNGDRSGSVFTHIDVPDFAKDQFSLSGLLIGAAMPGLTAQRDLFADLAPVVPTMVREFRPTAAVTSFLRIYQGGGKPVQAVRV